ncbi:L,D-transpeptidase family protein, partial [Enterovirga sp.]|uniref:L,D-transpeptidase family protein n=1 Tax=Enterovirga sp. TaxID=2026350 RepID=UPI002639FA78
RSSMTARRAGFWTVGLALLLGAAHAPAAADDVAAQLSRPELPAPLEVVGTEPGPGRDAASPTAEVAVAGLDLPLPPDVVVEVSAAAPAPLRAVADLPPEAPPAPLQLTLDDVLPGAIELRLADPKLPLPPKLAAKDRAALTAVYAARGYRPLWVEGGAWSARAVALATTLAGADAEGLDPADYPVPRLQAGTTPLTASDLAEAELKLSATAFLYARHARGGRLEPSRLSGMITPKLDLPSPEQVLAVLAESPAPAEALAAFNPAYPGYRALRTKLAELRANRPVARLSGSPDAAKQAAMGAAPARLPKVTPARLEGDIIANMERWRWLPAEVAPRHILVNIPEFRLRLMDQGEVRHEARVIVGKADTPTPLFTGRMDYAVVNPSWFVPPSILKKQLAAGGSLKGFVVTQRGKTTTVRQPPGPTNALGYIKLMFPNDHAVYLHDTPARHLFGSGNRALSHGCVRVEQPFALAGKIMGSAWTEEKLKKLIGWGERHINLAEPLPVHLGYFTVAIEPSGELRTFGDVYGHNRRVRTALGLGA